jgi:hypothetical protein
MDLGRERSMTYLKFEGVPPPSANVLAQPKSINDLFDVSQ